MKFVAIDFETANSSLDSICQIGVVVFADACLAETWQTLIDPDDYFDGLNVSIHGIEKKHVMGAPSFPDVFERLCDLLVGQVVIHHTAFDKVALTRTIEKHGLREIACQWLDTAKVVRRAWPEFARNGYGLANVAQSLGIDFTHHAAQEDARAAGEILLQAIRETGITLPDWLIRVTKPIGSSPHDSPGTCARNGDPDGPLFGEIVVFTGALCLPRHQMADLAGRKNTFVV
ncbi:MAG: 3'-5' exonuclease [Planctomycetia bacterium]|nr:3'-5' exonuclease [Planctomycetia bacterium]